MMLSDKVQTSSFHQQVFSLQSLLLNVGIESFLLALIGHGIGALASSTSHDIACLKIAITRSAKCKKRRILYKFRCV